MRVLATHLEYGWVRRAMSALPDEQDLAFLVGRPTSLAEEAALSHPHLLGDYVIDAHVAQVLTSSHLARAGTLDSYVLEEIAQDRFLAVARDSSRGSPSATPSLMSCSGAGSSSAPPCSLRKSSLPTRAEIGAAPPSRRGAEWAGRLA